MYQRMVQKSDKSSVFKKNKFILIQELYFDYKTVKFAFGLQYRFIFCPEIRFKADLEWF